MSDLSFVENSLDVTPPVTVIEAQNVCDSSQSKSKQNFMATLQNFLEWKINNNESSFSEPVFLAYFIDLAIKYKPSTLWNIHSKLKKEVLENHDVDIDTYSSLTAFLQCRSDGFVGQKSKVLSPNEVENFLKQAPDYHYLATKVALIFGITGACGRQELCNITTKDIEDQGELLVVTIRPTKANSPRTFIIDGPSYDIVKKYAALRKPKTNNDRFFLKYHEGKCTRLPIGVNKFGAMPKEIANFLRLPDADSYTGRSFRGTSTLLADAGGDILTVAESYIEDTIDNTTNISAKTQATNLEPAPKKFCLEPLEVEAYFANNDLAPPKTTESPSMPFI